jgi:hypothetical protein
MKASGFPKTTWWLAFEEMLDAGLKMTLKQDTRNLSIMCMIQDAVYDPGVSPVIYVMRSGSASGAMVKAAWYWKISDGTLPDPEARPDNRESDEDLFL